MLVFHETQSHTSPRLLVWFLTWSTLSESLTQQRRTRLKNHFFWSLYHNPDSPSMIHFHPSAISRLSIHDKPFDCKVVGFFTWVFVRNFQLMLSINLHLHLQTHFSRLLRTIVLWSRSQSRIFLVVQDFCIQKIDFVPYLRFLIFWNFRKMLWFFCLEIQTHFPP